MFTRLAKQKDDFVIPILDQINEENQFNLDKYKVAGEMVSTAMNELKEELVDGRSITELCDKYDALLVERVKDVYKHKSYQNGIAFPTCISVNNQAGYNSPPIGYDRTLKSGDLVKIEMGLQIDGFPVVMADTYMIGEANEKQANIMKCLEKVKENLKDYIKIGKNSREIHDYLKTTLKEYDCSLLSCDESVMHCPGIFSSQISQGVIDGRNEEDKEIEKHQVVFTGRTTEEFMIEPFDFQHNQCFVIDIAFSTGKGSVTLMDPKETGVYRCNPDFFYALKLKTSKQALSTLQKKSVEFPCSIRDLREKNFNFGIRECVINNIVEMYPVLYEKDGEYIVNYKFTVILRKGNKKKKNRNLYFN